MGKGKEKEQVNDGNLTLSVPENILERFIKIAEGSEERMEKKEAKYEVEVNFIRNEIKRVQEQMQKTDPLTEKYSKLVRVYDELMNVIRFC